MHKSFKKYKFSSKDLNSNQYTYALHTKYGYAVEEEYWKKVEINLRRRSNYVNMLKLL